eukprot:359937-Chlamydomonas_euryale.AAC.8
MERDRASSRPRRRSMKPESPYASSSGQAQDRVGAGVGVRGCGRAWDLWDGCGRVWAPPGPHMRTASTMLVWGGSFGAKKRGVWGSFSACVNVQSLRSMLCAGLHAACPGKRGAAHTLGRTTFAATSALLVRSSCMTHAVEEPGTCVPVCAAWSPGMLHSPKACRMVPRRAAWS